MNQLQPILQQWANFYATMGQAGAALIGLLFVVITVAAERRPNDTAKIHIYLTPIVVCFASVLGVGELAIIPDHTRLSAALCICLVGAIGAVYSASLFIRRGGRKTNYYELHDRIPYAFLPFAAYALLIAGGILLFSDIERALTLVAAGMLSLLTLGIRNSWAIVTDLLANRPGGK